MEEQPVLSGIVYGHAARPDNNATGEPRASINTMHKRGATAQGVQSQAPVPREDARAPAHTEPDDAAAAVQGERSGADRRSRQ